MDAVSCAGHIRAILYKQILNELNPAAKDLGNKNILPAPLLLLQEKGSGDEFPNMDKNNCN